MVTGYKHIQVSEDTLDDLEFLRLLTRHRGYNSTIQYLISCYAAYCEALGLKNYHYLEENRLKRYRHED